MKNFKFQTIATMFAVAAILIAVGCSNEEVKTDGGSISEAVDTIAGEIAHEFIDAAFANATEKTAISGADEPVADIADVVDMLVVDSVMYAVYHNGIIINDFAANEPIFIETGEVFNAVAMHDDQIYVGGEKLYTIVDNTLVPSEAVFSGTINDLISYGYALAIGTDQGLFSNSIIGDMTVSEDFAVVRMTADDDGLWVATDGDGLYRWDGERFNQRYLYRDTTIFDNVRALDFNHGHLYVGTDDGFFIYNGGSWQKLTAEDGLPSDWVIDIDATDWVLLIATQSGVISYFNGDFMPVKGLGEAQASSIERFGRKVLAGTLDQGILIKSGSNVKTLIEPQKEEETPIEQEEEIFSVSGE